MIRRFNYTKRKKIPTDRVAMTLRDAGTPEMSFDATIDLKGLKLPADAEVFVEAYYKSSYMRFAFGTVEKPAVPPDRRLSEIDGGTVVLFRVKVVSPAEGTGRIVAEVDGLVASEGALVADGKHSLLPVAYKDLGQQVWRLDFTNERPVLELNATVPGIRDLVRRDGKFIGLVFPAIVRSVLTNIVVVHEHDDLDDVSDWKCLWLRFISAYHDEKVPAVDDLESKLAWVEDALQGYCAACHSKDLYLTAGIEEGK